MNRRLIVLMLVLVMLPGCDGSGDRVLVAKFLYDTSVVPPDRYDVVVFKFPEEPIKDGTPKNYIKRLIGLPGEIIAIFLGRLYSFHHTGNGVPEGVSEEEWRKLADTSQLDPLELWRNPPKNHETAEKLWNEGKFQILYKPPPVMLALSRPVYDNDYQAQDLMNVLEPRWASEDGTTWTADDAKGFKIAGSSKTEEYLRYRHILRPPDWPAANDPNRKATIAEIKNRVHSPQLITDVLGYNSYEPHMQSAAQNWVGDLMLSCNLKVVEPKGEFWMELSKGVDRFQARFNLATGECSLYRLSEHKMKALVEDGQKRQVPDWQLLASAPTRIKASGTYQLRFANYDERLTLWVDRDLPFEDGKTYPPPAKLGPDSFSSADSGQSNVNNDLQPASLCSVGAAVEVHNLKLWRDTYYTDTEERADGHGAVMGDDWRNPEKWGKLRSPVARTFFVYPGHYLCLGDNSPESSDSRFWGLVPQRLMLGRALLVYFPFERAGTIK
jgi:signal peptidase I